MQALRLSRIGHRAAQRAMAGSGAVATTRCTEPVAQRGPRSVSPSHLGFISSTIIGEMQVQFSADGEGALKMTK